MNDRSQEKPTAPCSRNPHDRSPFFFVARCSLHDHLQSTVECALNNHHSQNSDNNHPTIIVPRPFFVLTTIPLSSPLKNLANTRWNKKKKHTLVTREKNRGCNKPKNTAKRGGMCCAKQESDLGAQNCPNDKTEKHRNHRKPTLSTLSLKPPSPVNVSRAP